MKVTIVNKKKKQQHSIIPTIFIFVLGLLLTFNSGGLLTSIFTFLGILVVGYGIFKLIRFYQLKQQFKVEESSLLMMGIGCICVGILVILLSHFITNAISIVTGIWLIFVASSKLNDAIILKEYDKKHYYNSLISSIILFLLGLYTIIAENVILVFIGIVLILYSGMELFDYFFNQKKK